MRKPGLTVIFLILSLGSSWACECIFIAESLQQKAKNYDYIFFAEVESLVDHQVEGFENTFEYRINPSYHLNGGYHPKLQVLEVFKGKVKKGMTGKYLVMDNDWSMCGEFFQPGQFILIFGTKGRKGGITTSTCASNWTFKSQEEFMLKKKELKKSFVKK